MVTLEAGSIAVADLTTQLGSILAHARAAFNRVVAATLSHKTYHEGLTLGGWCLA